MRTIDHPDTLSLQSMLDAMAGITYIVDPEGVILAYNRCHWDAFAEKNNAEHLRHPGHVLGHSLFSFVHSEEVQGHYRMFNRNIIERKSPLVQFQYRCDAPGVRRDMLMSISPVIEQKDMLGILYQSIILTETHRPAMHIFEYGPVLHRTEHWPIVGMCSYCLRLRNETVPTTWITPEEYYHSGGTEQVRISHGICPECYASIVRPQFLRSAS